MSVPGHDAKPSRVRRLVLATNNAHKIKEIVGILDGLAVSILTAADFPDFPDPEEHGATFEENARLKALAVRANTGLWSLADDSGLEVDALNGAPGVVSARFASPGCTFADNNAKLLRLLADLPDERRAARFRSVAALALGDNEVKLFTGEVRGIITREPRGNGGFGYDPVFFVPELNCTFAEAAPEAKSRLSHRGQAFRQVAKQLRELLAEP
ncbi:MAG: RdgB/HAM1 family non-canonical purine NTP pyrophosphatase [candidate division Zixibacteria bacterium]|nr:RdgB/HAM1 family non-canonical purine NTP pyrophosphatase [candidate division Zixibacteria bacterium]